MRKTENNLQVQKPCTVTPATRHEAPEAKPNKAEPIPTLLEFLNANGSRWCRIQIKPMRVLMSFTDAKKAYHYGSGKTLQEAYDMLQQHCSTMAVA